MNLPIHRRTACQAIAAGAAAAAFAAAKESPRDATPGYWLLASAMYGNLPLAELLKAAPQTGAQRLDLWRKPHADHWEQAALLGDEKFAALLNERNVKLGAITVLERRLRRDIRLRPAAWHAAGGHGVRA